MATIEQMSALCNPYITVNGVEYGMPPMNLATRKIAMQFIKNMEGLEDAVLANPDLAVEAFEELARLLQVWLGRVQPNITIEQYQRLA